MLRHNAVLVLIATGLIVVLAGCGGAGSSSPISPPTQKPTSVIFVSPPPTSLAVNASATIDASAIYAAASQSGSTQVTYSMSCGTPGVCGTFSASDEGGAITYTAPSLIPSGNTVTVTATSVADTTKSVSAAITIVAPIPITVAFFATPPASLQINSSFAMSAIITNDVSANPQVKWTVACSATACGSFNPTTTGSESQTTYTAPAAIPPGGNVTVTATSVTDPTKSASASIVIIAAAPTLADGSYVFQLSGSPGEQASFITGAFTAKGGAVTGGEQDTNYFSQDSDNNPIGYSYSEQITGGSYATTADGNLQVSLQIGANANETLTGTLVAGAKGFVAALNGSPTSGTLDLQTSTAAPSGGYAVSIYGGDEFTDSVWMGGILNVDSSGKISGAGSTLDVVDGQLNFGGTQPVGASTVSAPDAYGRVQLQLNPGSGSTLPAIYLAGYVIDATHIRLIEMGDANDSTNFQGVLGGTALGQGANTGHFSASSIAGSSYAFGAQGDDTKGPLQIAGVLALQSDGSVTGSLNWNDLSGTTPQSPVAFSGTYTVDATGRVTISKLSGGSGGEAFTYSLHMYLTGEGNGLMLSSDSGDVFLGQVFERQAATFGAGSFNSNYGLNATTVFNSGDTNVTQGPSAVVGSIAAVADGDTDTVAGFADNTGTGAASFAISGTFTAASNGIFSGTLAGFDPTAGKTPGNFTLYLVDGTQGVLIETDNAELSLGRVQRVQ